MSSGLTHNMGFDRTPLLEESFVSVGFSLLGVNGITVWHAQLLIL